MASKRRKVDGVELTKPAGKATQRKPLAAVRERERLRMFNESLESLQRVIPIRLPVGRKLHKKQTLQLACRYITFLRECLDGKRSWEERRRFWCSNDDDLNIIDAIDAAAAIGNTEPAKKIRRKRDPKPTEEATQPISSTPPPNAEVIRPTYVREIPREQHEVLRPQFVPKFVPKNEAPSVSDAVQYSNALLLAHTGMRTGGHYGDRGPMERVTSCHGDRLRNHVRRLDDVWPDLNEIISKNE